MAGSRLFPTLIHHILKNWIDVKETMNEVEFRSIHAATGKKGTGSEPADNTLPQKTAVNTYPIIPRPYW